ncbi:MAG: hypothetical protein MZU91_10760 [Desulfosudis oleivorans]|nr:hypothetical protein [Desulfosudis oleivorans]
MSGLVQWKGTLYSWNNGGSGGALDIRDYYGNFGNLGIANDLGADINGNLDYTAWARATRAYLPLHPEINVVIWSWCYQAAGTAAQIQLYLDQMDRAREGFPRRQVRLHDRPRRRRAADGQRVADPLTLRNRQIRDYCAANNKILYDFADIESYDPDGAYYRRQVRQRRLRLRQQRGRRPGPGIGRSSGRTPIRACGTNARRPIPSR